MDNRECPHGPCPTCKNCGKQMYHSATTGLHECRNDRCPPKVAYRLKGQRQEHVSNLDFLRGA